MGKVLDANLKKNAALNGGTITGGLRGLVTGGRDACKANQKAVEALREECPLVAEILAGIPADGEQPAFEGSPITFFINDGRLRFSANVKSSLIKFVGDVADPLLPWHSINTALLTGDVSSKRYTEQAPTTKVTEEPPH